MWLLGVRRRLCITILRGLEGFGDLSLLHSNLTNVLWDACVPATRAGLIWGMAALDVNFDDVNAIAVDGCFLGVLPPFSFFVFYICPGFCVNVFSCAFRSYSVSSVWVATVIPRSLVPSGLRGLCTGTHTCLAAFALRRRRRKILCSSASKLFVIAASLVACPKV